MNTEHINKLLSAPATLSVSDLPDLRQLVQDYPWCQSFQVLYAKALKLNDDPGFNHQLKKTAVYATDRKILYRLIMQPGLQKSIADFEELTASTKPEEAPEAPSPAAPTDVEVPTESGQEQESSTSFEGELDSQNLEQEVLKEVAAQAYQLEFESKSEAEEKEMPEPAEEKPVSQQTQSEISSPTRPLSFIDFIRGGQPGAASKGASEAGGDEHEDSLIERFIQNEPKIERKKTNFFSPVNMGKMSLVDNDEMVSETLAGIYARQGDLDKARRAYEQLALKYPEKSSYFAGLIKKMEASKSKK